MKSRGATCRPTRRNTQITKRLATAGRAAGPATGSAGPAPARPATGRPAGRAAGRPTGRAAGRVAARSRLLLGLQAEFGPRRGDALHVRHPVLGELLELRRVDP